MIANVKPQDKKEFNRLAFHPLQSWEWGDFRQKTGIEVIRLGRYENDKLLETAQITIHQLPFTKYTIGYFPKGNIPTNEMLKKLVEIGKQYNCIFIKLEPNVKTDTKNSPNILISQYPNIHKSSHPLFTKYTFQLDLTKSEEELLKNMHPKTRYNIKIAQKHEVVVKEENSAEAFQKYLELTFETAKRQKFYAHNRRYHELMWETLKGANVAHLLTASYQSQILVTWIVFLFNNVLYYPYGASSDQYRNVMASNLMMWEAIKFGKKNGTKLFDMWGALGPNPDPSDPWYGFHRFKQGYGANLVEFIGSFDLVIRPTLYKLYNLTYKIREKILAITS